MRKKFENNNNWLKKSKGQMIFISADLKTVSYY